MSENNKEEDKKKKKKVSLDDFKKNLDSKDYSVFMTEKEEGIYNRKRGGSIYKITNLKNGKVYIGRTKNSIADRMYGHMSVVNSDSNDMLIDTIMRNQGVVKYIYEDQFKGGFFVDSIGIKKFGVEEIDYVQNIDDLCDREKYWIAQYKSYIGDFGTRFGYNQTKGGEPFLFGEDHPFYIKIDRNRLRELIRTGYSGGEIAGKLGICIRTVRSKTREFWGMNLLEAREHFGGEEAYKERLRKRLSESRKRYGFSEDWRKSASIKRSGAGNIMYRPIDKDTLKSLIEEHLLVKEIAEILEIHYTTVYDKMNEFWGKTSIIALRSQFGVENPTRWKYIPKEALKKLLAEGKLTLNQIASYFGVVRSTLYKRIKEFSEQDPNFRIIHENRRL